MLSNVWRYYFSGPFVSFVINKWSCRVAAITSGCCLFTGFSLSFFAPNLIVLLVTYGVIAGQRSKDNVAWPTMWNSDVKSSLWSISRCTFMSLENYNYNIFTVLICAIKIGFEKSIVSFTRFLILWNIFRNWSRIQRYICRYCSWLLFREVSWNCRGCQCSRSRFRNVCRRPFHSVSNWSIQSSRSHASLGSIWGSSHSVWCLNETNRNRNVIQNNEREIRFQKEESFSVQCI